MLLVLFILDVTHDSCLEDVLMESTCKVKYKPSAKYRNEAGIVAAQVKLLLQTPASSTEVLIQVMADQLPRAHC